MQGVTFEYFDIQFLRWQFTFPNSSNFFTMSNQPNRHPINSEKSIAIKHLSDTFVMFFI
jgi:hypothetical protein